MLRNNQQWKYRMGLTSEWNRQFFRTGGKATTSCGVTLGHVARNTACKVKEGALPLPQGSEHSFLGSVFQ